MLTHRHEHTFGELLRQYDEHHALVGRKVTVLRRAGGNRDHRKMRWA